MPLVVHQRGDKLFGRPLDHPITRAISGIVTGHAFVAGQDHLSAAAQLANDRHAIASGVVFAHRLPKRDSISATQCHNIGITIVIAIDNDLVSEQHRRTAKTVHAMERPWAHDPPLFPGKIVSRHEHLIVIQKCHIDQFAVGCGRARGMAV